MIQGVAIKKIITHHDDRGFFAEIVKFGEETFHEIKQTSYTETYPGVIKAFHWHKKQWDIWFVAKGMAQVVLYDLRENSILTDFCIIGSGNSITHIRALSQHLNKSFKNIGILPRNIEGTPESQWILMDYNDVLIHLFLEDLRRYYDIEKLFENNVLIYPETESI